MFKNLIISFLIALQFLTIIPIRLPVVPTIRQNALSMLFYPVIGLMIGGVLWAMAIWLSVPALLVSCLMVSVWAWLTGGLHLDGLADTADGWVGGYGDKVRTLAIMKDSHIGAMGVLALVVVLMLKWASLLALLSSSVLNLVLVPMLGRLTALWLFLTTPYVSKNGLGLALQETPKVLLAIVLALSMLMVVVVLGWQGWILLGVWVCLVSVLRCAFVRRLGGITGDTVGASIELVEMTMLVSLVFLVSS